jgi:hypothetical protein
MVSTAAAFIMLLPFFLRFYFQQHKADIAAVKQKNNERKK